MPDWIDVKVGDKVRVNNPSGAKHGKEGVVRPHPENNQAMKKSSFGHKWAFVEFPDETQQSIRTCLLEIV